MGMAPAEDICKNVVNMLDRIRGEAVRWVVQRSQNLDHVPATPLPGGDPKEQKVRTGTDVHTPTFIAAL